MSFDIGPYILEKNPVPPRIELLTSPLPPMPNACVHRAMVTSASSREHH